MTGTGQDRTGTGHLIPSTGQNGVAVLLHHLKADIRYSIATVRGNIDPDRLNVMRHTETDHLDDDHRSVDLDHPIDTTGVDHLLVTDHLGDPDLAHDIGVVRLSRDLAYPEAGADVRKDPPHLRGDIETDQARGLRIGDHHHLNTVPLVLGTCLI